MAFGEGRSGGRGFGGGGGFRGGGMGPREMFDATCSECGQPCKVPFKPSNDAQGNARPVYCRECYAKRKPQF